MTILPPPPELPDWTATHVPDHDDEQVDWSVVEAQGVDYPERRDSETADTARPPRSP